MGYGYSNLMSASYEHNYQPYFHAWSAQAALKAVLTMEGQKVIWASATLLALDRTAPVRVEGGALTFAERGKQTQFSAFIAELADQPSVWVLGKGDGDFLLIRCQRFQPDGQAPLVSCVIFSERSGGSSVWADLGAVFGLTAAEAGIARRLVDGELLTDVAADLSITQETAKTHLRRIYAKVGAGSREEFYAKLLPFRLV